ncbi:MAG: response regulator [Proteobacteria bacterium]|nr:response regulator [Pseudomonadota bacterium]
MSDANILLVDDEQPFVETMTKRLEKRNYKVNAAFSGYDAIKILEKESQVEVVILDVKMPGKDGIGVLQEIKQKYPLIEVIMLTGHATVESAIQGMKLGAYDYLMKPCDMNELVAKVDEATGKKRAHEEKIVEARMKRITGTRI